ncbi:hypothetical protein [Pajaroellobacter abortibovis]|nr:hypothetical protein [Pajaroellobacter abortibovis]
MVGIPLSDYVLRLFQGVAAAAHSQRLAYWEEQAMRLKIGSEAKLTFYD